MTTGYMCYSAPVTLAATGRDRSHVNVANVALKLGLDVAKCWYRPDTPRIVRIQGNYSRARKRPVSVAAWWQLGGSLVAARCVCCSV